MRAAAPSTFAIIVATLQCQFGHVDAFENGFKVCPTFDEMVQCPGGPTTGCLWDYEVCNGVEDCLDGSDEQGCRMIECDWKRHMCPSRDICIRDIDKCDGIRQCPDGSDEENCPDEAMMQLEESCTVVELESGGFAENAKFFTKFYYAEKGSHYTRVSLIEELDDNSHVSKCQNIGGLPDDRAYGITKYGTSVWITGDCKAKFKLCYHGYSASHLGHERTDHEGCKTLWLHGYMARAWVYSLPMLGINASGPITSLTLMEEATREEFHGRCREGYSWGNQGRRIWVSLGCVGEFKVCSVTSKRGGDDGLSVGRVKHDDKGKDGWTQYVDGFYYKLYTDTLTWDQAAQECAKDDAEMATSRSPKYNDFLLKLIKQSRKGVTEVWLYGSDQKTEGTFLWEDDGDTIAQTRWANFKGGPSELKKESKCQLEKLELTCKAGREIRIYSVFYGRKVQSMSCKKCPDGWTRHKDACYSLFPRRSTLDEARRACQDANADLASSLNANENGFLSKLLEKASRENPGLPYDGKIAWLGGTDRSQEGAWKWSNRDPWTSWQSWSNGKPDQKYANEDCMTLHWPTHTWNDIHCKNQLPFICKKYGRHDTTHCDNPDINARWLTALRDRCEGKPSCTVPLDDDVGGDSCPGYSKYLNLNYSCEPEKNEKEDCLLMHPNGFWDDVDCKRVQMFVCRKTQWTTFKDREYRLYPEGRTYEQAVQKCVDDGAELVTSHSKEENAFFVNYLKTFDAGQWNVPVKSHNVELKQGYTHMWLHADAKWSRDNFTWMDAGVEVLKSWHPWSSEELKSCDNSGWNKYKKGCYKSFDTKETWNVARQKCIDENGDLPNARNPENNKIVEQINNKHHPNTLVWISGQDPDGDNKKYQWMDTGEQVTWLHWRGGEPNYKKERCMSMHVGPTFSGDSYNDKLKAYSGGQWQGHWLDSPCNYEKWPFICTKARSVPSAGDPGQKNCLMMDSSGQWFRHNCDARFAAICKKHGCDAGWRLFDGKCFKVHEDMQTWDKASAACIAEDATLVSSPTPVYNSFLKDLATPTWRPGEEKKVWLNSKDEEKEGTWMWYDTGDDVTWSNFHPLGCKTGYGDCDKWAKMGLCFLVPAQMERDCKEACGFCDGWKNRKDHNCLILQYDYGFWKPMPCMRNDLKFRYICQKKEGEPKKSTALTASKDEKHMDCWPRNKPHNYIGVKSISASNITCQAWNKQEPHKHELGVLDSEFVDGKMNHNYCRFLTSGKYEDDEFKSNLPWCYIVDKKRRWEYCDIPECKGGEGDRAAGADHVAPVTSLVTWVCTAAVCWTICSDVIMKLGGPSV